MFVIAINSSRFLSSKLLDQKDKMQPCKHVFLLFTSSQDLRSVDWRSDDHKQIYFDRECDIELNMTVNDL